MGRPRAARASARAARAPCRLLTCLSSGCRGRMFWPPPPQPLHAACAGIQVGAAGSNGNAEPPAALLPCCPAPPLPSRHTLPATTIPWSTCCPPRATTYLSAGAGRRWAGPLSICLHCQPWSGLARFKQRAAVRPACASSLPSLCQASIAMPCSWPAAAAADQQAQGLPGPAALALPARVVRWALARELGFVLR